MIQTKKPLIVAIAIAIIITLGIITLSVSSEVSPAKYESNQPETNINEEVVSTSSSSNTMETSVQSYTLEEIALHATESDCWTAIDGSVYNLTQFIADHPGGRKAILRLCGTDGTQAFQSAHGKGGRGQQAVFAKYKIGILER